MFVHKAWRGLLPLLGALALIALWMLLPAGAAAAPSAPQATVLSPGDIAIIGFNFDNPDQFAFVLLTDITAGTEIHFTDDGWLASGGFRTGEGEDIWTASADMSAGTVVTVTASGMALSSSGDQIIAFQGTLASPTLIYALNSDGTGWQTDATSSNTSALPAGLTDGYTAIALSEIDNAQYDIANGSAGTKDALLNLIGSTANWSGSNSVRQSLSFPSFTVTASTATDLTISAAGTRYAVIGEDLFYTITVSSQGMTATNVVVTDTLPLSVTFAGASITYTSPVSGVYVFDLGAIVSGTQATFNITATTSLSAAAGQVFTNTVVVSTTAAGDNPANNAASLVSTVYPLVSIHDIQYVADPAASDTSPYSGQTVFVEGIVVAAPGELGSRAMVIEDAAGGAWSGLYVYDSGSFTGLTAPRGAQVRVLGSVTEYYGLTELAFTSAEVLSTGNSLPAPAVIPSGDFVSVGAAEQWEAVLIEFQNATVTDPALGYGEWAFDDGSGAARADDMGAFTYVPTLGDFYDYIRGIGWYSYGNYKLEPRADSDISLGTAPADLGISQSGPAAAAPGETLVYSLTVQNQRSITVTGVVVTDTLPLSVTFDGASITYTSPVTGVYVFTLGDLGAGMTSTIQVTASAPMSGSWPLALVNTAVVTTTTPGDNPANNAASVTTMVYPLVSIYDIQYVADPAADDASPYNGQKVFVEGVVTAAPGEIDTPPRGMALADPAGGAWSGVWVFQFGGLPAGIQEGDYVRVLGTVKEYYGLTEIDPSSGSVQVLTPTYGSVPPAVLNTSDFPEKSPAASEQWEGVLVEFRMATVTDENLGYGEWAFDDGSGAVRADDLGGRDGNLTYTPANGDVYNYIRGIGWYSYGNYKLEPRRDADISLHYDAPLISKSAPSNVTAGGVFTYTITVGNFLGYDLTSVVITDTAPAGLSGITPLDGGLYANGTLTWTLASLPSGGSVSVRFSAAAPSADGTVLTNDRYAVRAAEWPTPTFGAPVYTVVGAYTPIPLIQGNGMLSAFKGQSVKTEGVVVGFFQGNSSAAGNFNGFFIQDPNGDGDPHTSDAIFVNYGTAAFSGVSVGDRVAVTGTVQEFSEWDGSACYGDACLTQVAVSTADISVVGTGAVSPTVLTPPGDPVSSTLYFESLEGMLVTIPATATVVGPTSYGTIQVVPGSLGIDRVMRGGPFEGMPVGVRPDERYGSGAPDLATGSVVSGVDGPLTFSYNDYLIADQDGYAVVQAVQPPTDAPSWPAPAPMQFSAATMNTYNFDAADPALKATKVVSQVLQMNAPTFLALQEIDAAGVMSDVLAGLSAAGYVYDFAYSHPDVGGHGVALLWRADMVTNVVTSTAYQSCSASGSSSSTYDPMWSACQAAGEYPLFSRRPVVLTATVNLASGPQQVVVIANHFKSKRGGAPADQRRLEQGQFVHDLAASFESQTPYVLVMGDLNDFEDSAPLQALYAGDVLTNTWFTLPPEQRYSYVYQGVSQILDHILVSPALLGELTAMSPLHLNADYPYNAYYGQAVVWRNSDHDPVAATFSVPYRVLLPLVFNQYGP